MNMERSAINYLINHMNPISIQGKNVELQITKTVLYNDHYPQQAIQMKPKQRNNKET
jgi:hypothetical protein